MAIAIRRIARDDGDALERYVAIRNAVTPTMPDSLEQIRWAAVTYPASGARFLATLDDEAVGTAITGRIWMHVEDYPRFWLGIWVLPGARGRGIGTALYEATSEVARAAGKTGLELELSEEYESGHRFLARRGFVEIDRSKQVRLDLTGLGQPEVVLPDGYRLTTLAERPDLVPGVHTVALEAFPDIPTAGRPMDVGSLEEFTARDVARPGIPPDAFLVALDAATDEAAGYASLSFAPGSTHTAWHDMTAVRRRDRGRGLATALKRATIGWAIDHGLDALETGNDEHNAPMRAVNARLGYRPAPDLVGLRGPLANP